MSAIDRHMRQWDEALKAHKKAFRADIASQLVAQGCEHDVADYMAEFYAATYERGCYNIVMYGHHNNCEPVNEPSRSGVSPTASREEG